eukprot:360889-Chlamydomonas_euryale.AAC.3
MIVISCRKMWKLLCPDQASATKTVAVTVPATDTVCVRRASGGVTFGGEGHSVRGFCARGLGWWAGNVGKDMNAQQAATPSSSSTWP